MDARVSSPVFIGRSDELLRLRAALGEAEDGQSSRFLVGGEAGVGKTRLVGEFSDGARRDGALVLAGGCIDLGEGGLPYAPIVEALRTWVRGADEDVVASILGQGRPDLARLVPDLGHVSGADSAAGSGLNIGSTQGRFFELLLGVLHRLADSVPLVLVVEDLHWSDRSTRDLLAFLVRNIRDVGVVLVMTYRSDELHRRHPLLPFLAELERSGRVERLELTRFDRHEAAAQLAAIAGPDLDPALVESIHARSSGNPFFAEELLVSARDTGKAALPPTLREVLLAHVASLTEATQELLRVASAAGHRVDPQLLAMLNGSDPAALYGSLREAVGHHILVPELVTAGYTTKQSDLYQLGLLMYEMHTGEYPLDTSHGYDAMLQQIKEGVPRLKAEALGTPIGNIVSVLLRRNEQYRYTSPAQVWEELRRLNVWADEPRGVTKTLVPPPAVPKTLPPEEPPKA